MELVESIKENKETTPMPHYFVQWALCFQNVGFNIFPFGLATVGFLTK